MSKRHLERIGRPLAAFLLSVLAATGAHASPEETAGALKIGLLLNLGGPSGRGQERQRAFELAIKHLNEAGGVLGGPVATAVADSTLDPATAVAVARRLVEEEGVHAIVGPSSSANTIPVGEQVSGPAQIPTISPSATSPLISTLDDGDFLFRTALSDRAQGPVLARVTSERGFDNVGVIYRDDAWGQGLAEAFVAAWPGTATVVRLDPGQTTAVTELRRSAGAGAQALVVITFEQEGNMILREAIAHGLYDRFVFGDAVKSPAVIREIGAEHLAGTYGAAGATAPNNPASAPWEAAHVAEYGALPTFAYVRETYDATIALALAAQAAGSTDGAAIRDHLRAVGSGPGTVVLAGAEGIAAALRILAAGGTVDYDGAAATLDWDANGDLRRGHIGIWRITEDGAIEDVEVVPFAFDDAP